MLRLHVIEAVFKRNFMSYFSGVVGYLFIVAFVFVGSFLAFQPQFFANNLANLDQLNHWFAWLLLFIVPAITMSTWSDERKQGTDELLFTLPASDFEILLGKYLAVLGVYTVALIFSLSHVFILIWLGSPDKGLLFATYFGYWVAGSALLTAGMLASALTSSPAVAFVLGAIFCAIPVFIDKIPFAPRLLQSLSVAEQFRDFGLGMIPAAGLLYFGSLAAFFLYLNHVLISRRHWSGGPHQSPMWVHYLVRAAALCVILIGVNSIATARNPRLDLTRGHIYSLTPTTKKVLSSVKADRPVLIQAFISPEVPHELVPTRTTLIGLLRQFQNKGGSGLQVRIANTEKYTDVAEEAKRYGIESVEVQSEPGGRIVRDDIFMGVVITSVDQQVVIPFFDKGTPVEYELTGAIRTVSQATRKTVGILRTDAQVAGGFDMQSFRSLPEWRIAQELKKQYDVKTVGPEELATTTLDVLIAVMPSSLTDPEMQNLVDYVSKGNATLIFDDPFPAFMSGVAPHNPKPRAGGGMMGMMGGQQQSPPKSDDGKATKLLKALEIGWDHEETVWDRYDSDPKFREFLLSVGLYDVVYIDPASEARFAFNPESPITKDLHKVMLFYPGSLRPQEKRKLTFEPLMRSGPHSLTYGWNDYITSAGGMAAMFGGGGMMPVMPPAKSARDEEVSPVIAARITGSAGESGKSINAIFVADMDMITNAFFFIRDKEWQSLKVDNIAFVLNAVDVLANDDELLALRSRQPQLATLERIEKSKQVFKKQEAEQSVDAEKEAKSALEGVQKDLDEEAEAIRNDSSLDPDTQRIKLMMAQQNKQRELDVKKANIEDNKKRKIKKANDETQKKVREIEGSAWLLATFLPPIPALILGIIMFAFRIQGEREGINPDRLVSRKSA
ncbi:MAG: Gldg family protein [Planctomycetes bacterium]|nr:Gldg family protein [Planctomycetota bacterium]